MKNSLTPRQMINAELAIRSSNKTNAKKLKNHIPESEQEEIKIAFKCECSDLSCGQRVFLSLDEYEKLHNKFSRFVIVRGHAEPRVEKVIASSEKVSLVEKYALN